MKKLALIVIAVILLSCTINPVQGQWKKLAKKDLSGWEQLNGTALFKLEKGVVTGTTVLNSPNSFLCTKEKYGDFILEFDTWFDPQMNSGVQFRSESRPDYQNGRVHGYQVELDPSERAWSGGIYDEARRGWLYTPVIPQTSYLDNILTEIEVKEGWKLLFDGKTSTGWMNAKTKTFPASGWEIKDGTLTINPATKTKGGGGDIVTADKFGSFELIVDFKYTKGANSGIKYFIDTEINNGSLASIGCEYQVLDDRNHPDAKAGVGENRTLAGLYDLIAPKNKRDNGIDSWNRAIIIVNGNKVQHWLNGQLTVEYERGNSAWRELVAKSKFKDSPGFGEVKQGRILLQDHGNYVSYKNIKIREIK